MTTGNLLVSMERETVRSLGLSPDGRSPNQVCFSFAALSQRL